MPPPQKRCVEVLTPGASECDLIWYWVTAGVTISVEMRSYWGPKSSMTGVLTTGRNCTHRCPGRSQVDIKADQVMLLQAQGLGRLPGNHQKRGRGTGGRSSRDQRTLLAPRSLGLQNWDTIRFCCLGGSVWGSLLQWP